MTCCDDDDSQEINRAWEGTYGSQNTSRRSSACRTSTETWRGGYGKTTQSFVRGGWRTHRYCVQDNVDCVQSREKPGSLAVNPNM